MFLVLYVFCLFQRRKNISKELIEKQISDIDITSYAKISSVLSILNDSTINVVEKEKLAIKSLDSNIPNIKKLNIVILYLNSTDKKSTVLNKLYASGNKNIIAMTKFIVKNPDNIPDVLKCVKQSFIPITDKFLITEHLANKKLSNDDITICNEIRNENMDLLSIAKEEIVNKSLKKVSFAN
jgi:hypothetical protein